MRVITSGHKYALENLKSSGETLLQFHCDGAIHGLGNHRDGPSTQEVLRACIDRVKHLDSEKRWEGNDLIIQKLREVIALFEARALLRKIEKQSLEIESFPLGDDGHVQLVE